MSQTSGAGDFPMDTDPLPLRHEIDTTVPSVARAYDYLIGGKDNFEPDRLLGDQLKAAIPNAAEGALENRRTLIRMVRWLSAEAGIRQFIDLGAGLPSAENTHEVAQRVSPDARVVYIDHDPIVLAHGRALLAENGNTSVVTADFLQPDEVLNHREVLAQIDFTQPIGFLMVGILHHIPDSARPIELIKRYVDALPSGSYLAITAWVDTGLQVQHDLARLSLEHLGEGVIRTPEHLREHFVGLPLVEPGLVYVPVWHPDEPTSEGDLLDHQRLMMGGIARKP